MTIEAQSDPILLYDLGTKSYPDVLEFQTRLRDEKLDDGNAPDYLVFVEHTPVFTFGKNGGKENLMVSKDFLDQQGVDTVQTTRGGNITYHGPGQAVLYPIIDLTRAKIGVADFVHGLEQVMINAIDPFDIAARRDPKNHGIWVGHGKIGSVGLAIKKGISMHGLALNVDLDLTPFSWVNPCGMTDVSITSIKKESEKKSKQPSSVTMNQIKKNLISGFCQIFNMSVKESVEYAHQTTT